LGNPIYAPGWWLDRLGNVMRDGELWMGYDWRGDLFSICKQGLEKSIIDARWQRVQYHQYGVPNAGFFRDRKVGKSRFCAGLTIDSTIKDLLDRTGSTFSGMDNCTVAQVREHVNAPTTADFDAVLAKGGEGIVIKDGRWRCERDGWFKVKPFDDAEGIVVGHNPGEGRHTGRLGSYQVSSGGKVFNLSGMNDAERDKPRPFGSAVRFLYRGRTPDGSFIEARITSDRLGD
jgi:DNA ligase-1